MTGLFILFFALQLLVPLRHFLYPGDVFWTQEGYRFSWQMYLRDNDAARTMFHVVDPASGEAWDVKGLYVCDGAALPTALGVNPMVTIEAVAHKIARGVAAELT